MSDDPQAFAALEARQMMLEIEALEDAWSKARKSAERAGEVSFKLSELVQALRKENTTLQEQVQYNIPLYASVGIIC